MSGERWTIHKKLGEWDDVIQGPDTPEGGVVVASAQDIERDHRQIDWLCEHNARLVEKCTAEDGSDLPPARFLKGHVDEAYEEVDRLAQAANAVLVALEAEGAPLADPLQAAVQNLRKLLRPARSLDRAFDAARAHIASTLSEHPGGLAPSTTTARADPRKDPS